MESGISEFDEDPQNNNFAEIVQLNRPLAGKIILILGPMFACKTKTLINYIDRHMIAKKKCVVVRHAIDTRYDSAPNQDTSPDNIEISDFGACIRKPFIVTHDLVYYRKCPVISTKDLNTVAKEHDKYDVIGIDEGQFFPDLVYCAELLANLGKIVYITGLSGDFKQNAFPVISELVPKCSDLIFVKAVCVKCQNDASFTIRTSNEKEQVVVGADEKYIPVCRACLEFN